MWYICNNDWDSILAPEIKKPYFQHIINTIDMQPISPLKENIFRAFRLTPFANTRVVIIGQDPYPTTEADGLAFSAEKITPSLRNIFAEIGGPRPPNGKLDRWATQGVLLLNSILTIGLSPVAVPCENDLRPSQKCRLHGASGEESKVSSNRNCSTSHKALLWEDFTDYCISQLTDPNIIFLLWGNYARKKKQLLDSRHVLEAPHPSPLARGFVGCGHFAKVNEMLNRPIVW